MTRDISFTAGPTGLDQSAKNDNGTYTILVVEDEQGVRNITCKLLNRYGYEVLSASDGDDAVTVFSEQSTLIDLVMLDMSLPKRSGREVFEAIRGVTPTVPVIIVSGRNDNEVATLTSTNRCDFMMKPYRPGELNNAIQSILNIQ